MRKNILFLLVFVLGIWFLPALADSKCRSILVVGDSLSAAYNIPTDQSWVSLLQKRLKQNKFDYCVVNASVAGDTSLEALGKLPNLITEHLPEIVIIQLGGNDGLRGLNSNNLEQNLGKMIEHVQKNKAHVLLIGVRLPGNYGPDYIEQFVAIYPRLAEKYQVALLRQILKGVAEREELMQTDGIHPTAKAQPLILDNIWPVLEPLL